MRCRTRAERQDYADDLDLRGMTPEQADAEMEARDRKRYPPRSVREERPEPEFTFSFAGVRQ
jgi:hypothetical protein